MDFLFIRFFNRFACLTAVQNKFSGYQYKYHLIHMINSLVFFVDGMQ